MALNFLKYYFEFNNFNAKIFQGCYAQKNI